METHPGEGVVKEEKFPSTRKPSHQQVCGKFWNLGGQHNREEKKKNPQITPLATTPSREVGWTLAFPTNKWGRDREERATLLRVRTRPECPEENLRELT